MAIAEGPRRAPVGGMNSETNTPPLPACGFKEWSLVCEALGAGAQSIILRKGGIHEGRSGFFWKHDRFFLFPTHFHEQGVEFPWPEGTAPAGPGSDEAPHTLTHFAAVAWKHQLTTWAQVERLRGLHYWTDDTIRARFDYTDEAGISLAFVRVWRVEPAWSFPHLARYGGCRSWLELPDVPRDLSLSPVLTDAEDGQRLRALRDALSFS